MFSAGQALLAAKAGATYVSPFVGRLDDICSDGVGLVAQIVDLYQTYDYTTQVLAASIRNTLHIFFRAPEAAACQINRFFFHKSPLSFPKRRLSLFSDDIVTIRSAVL